MHTKKAFKRGVKLSVNILALSLSVVLLILVAATQEGSSYITTGNNLPVLGNVGCKLDVGSVGVCAYSYVLGGLGILLSLFVIMLTFLACATDSDAPVLLDGTIHALGAIWWTIGVAVLGTFVARANSRYNPLESDSAAARVAIVLVALANCILYVLSVWSNTCCCIARYKHETISMYV